MKRYNCQICLFQNLDEDVQRERQLIMQGNAAVIGSVIVVKDLVKKFNTKKTKSNGNRVYLAVDHLNFLVQKRACFGLLGIEYSINI